MDIDQFLELTKKRRTIRRFNPDPIPDGCIEKILEAARFAQSGGNAQPWEFIVVKNPETKNRIVELIAEAHKYNWDIEKTRVEELRHPAYRGEGRQGEPTVTFKDAPVFIVVCGDPRRVQATVIAAHFIIHEGGPQAHFLKNIGNATQIIHLAAAACGLGSQWVTVSSAIEARLKDLLDLPVEFAVHTIVPIGYPAYTPAPNYRRDLSEMVHYEKYDRTKYATGEDIYNYLLKLRNKTVPAYPYRKKV
ncbi:MAG: nitroreductase family protein [Chloroflexota bacterium]|nr:nitroreductase family protein [Chloroflexota bacterium]